MPLGDQYRIRAALIQYDRGTPSLIQDPQMRYFTERHYWGLHHESERDCPPCIRERGEYHDPLSRNFWSEPTYSAGGKLLR